MQRIVFDDWTLIPASGELTRGGTSVRLQEQALQVLLALLERPGEVVTREELIARLWPNVVVDYESSLKSVVRKLRLALADDAEHPRYVETLPRKGYRFVGTLAVAAPSDSPARAEAHRLRAWRRPLIGALTAAAFALLGAVVHYGPSSQRIRLGVMPLENLSPDPTNAFFADGLHEEIIGTLASRASDMDVISRTTMMSYRGELKAVADIARELSVTHVLEGSVRREGREVRVAVQLIEARTDRRLWSQSYDRELGNAMTLQSEVANAVAAQLAVKLANRGGGLPPSRHPDAYDAYLKALLALRAVDQRTPTADFARIEQWLSDAIALDGSFAAAYVQRAQLRLSAYVQNHDVSEHNRNAARLDIETARRLAGDAVAVVQASSRYSALFEAGPDEAFAILDSPELAASREPAVLLWRAFFLLRAGRAEQGLAAYAQAAALDPGNPSIAGAWERELWALRRPAEALAVVRDFNERQPGSMRFGDLEFAFTGDTARLRADIEAASPRMAADSRLLALFDLFRYERRFAELDELLRGLHADTVRVGGFREYGAPGTGSKPVAELLGWAELLNDASAQAADEGRALLAFVASQTATPHNAWHLRMLAAEGALFLGDRARAVEDTRAALDMTPQRYDFLTLYSRMMAARIYAWAGADALAVELLEQLSTGATSVGPAEIVRDPLFAIPLSGNGRYAALAQRLEAELERNRHAFR